MDFFLKLEDDEMTLLDAQIGQSGCDVGTTGADKIPHETVAWDDEVKGLGLRTRGSKQTWILQWRVDGRSRKTTFGAASDIAVTEARALARDVLAAAVTGEAVALSKSTTMAGFAERFLKDCAGQWKPGTLKTNRGFIKRSIIPAIGTKTVASINPDVVHDFISGLDVAPDTATRILSILSGMMKHAELWDLRPADSNPCRGMRKRKSAFTAQYVSDAELGRLGAAFNQLETVYPDAIQMFRFLALTGCRLGEARDLRWDMIDGHRVALRDAKGGPSAIWLGAPAKRLLASRPQTHAQVFVTGDAPIKPSDIIKAWNAVRQAARLPKLRAHDLRHNFAKVTVTLSYDLRVLKDLLNHKDLATTQGYAHLDVATKQKASARVGRHIDRLKVKEKRVQASKPAKLSKPPQVPKAVTPPKPVCHYSGFVRSRLAMAAFCEAQNLVLEEFRIGLIVWRAENGGAA